MSDIKLYISIITLILTPLFLSSCSDEPTMANQNEAAPETVDPIATSTGWCCLDFTAYFASGPSTGPYNEDHEAPKFEVCRTDYREFQMEWNGSQPDNFAWYISNDHNPVASDKVSSQKDIILNQGSVNDNLDNYVGTGDTFYLTAEAYDDPNNPTPYRYGAEMTVKDCSDPDYNPCDPGEYFSNISYQCEPYPGGGDSGIGSN